MNKPVKLTSIFILSSLFIISYIHKSQAAVVNVNDPPGGSVYLSGIVEEDQTLTASNDLTDIDGLGPITYQWQRDDGNISGANGTTYTLGDADVGTIITVGASYTDGGGILESVSSAGTIPVVNVNDLPGGNVVITGIVEEDQILTADTTGITDDDGLGPFNYQWRRGGINITGETASTYTLGDVDVNTVISVVVTYTDLNNTDESLTSLDTIPVVNVNDLPIGNVVIAGLIEEDETVWADTRGLSDEGGFGTFSYQWQRNLTVILGANANAYTLGDADVGTSMTVVVSYIDQGGTAESVTSVPTIAVVNVNDPPVGIAAAISPVEDNTFNGTLTATDIDNIPADFIFSRVTNTTNGNVTVNPDGTYQFVPNLDFDGTDSFTFMVNDGIDDALAAATVTITMQPVNDPPVGISAPFDVDEGQRQNASQHRNKKNILCSLPRAVRPKVLGEKE